MTSHCCYCNCNNNANLSEEEINTEKPCGNTPLERDPEIIRCPACNNEFQTDLDNSKCSDNIADVEYDEIKFDICPDVLFVDGNQVDLDESKDECTLMERVWFLSKPPLIEKQLCVVPARRVQVTRERLSSNIKCVPTIKVALRPQIERNLNLRRHKKKNSEYVPVRRISFEDDELEDSENSLPPCAQKLSEFLG